jgi:TPR repeat protein
MRIALFSMTAVLVGTVAFAQSPRGGYTRVEILPLGVPYGTVVPREFREALAGNLAEEIRKTGLFEEVVAPGATAPAAGTLKLATAITKFDPGDRDVRAGVGLGFGTTRMTVQARFLDARSCAIVADGHADGRVIGGWLGGDSLGATRGVAKDVARLAGRVNRRDLVDAPTRCDPDDGVTAVGATAAPVPDVIAGLMADAVGGDPVAQRNLAIVYLKGLGVPANESTAMKWCKRAAENGDAAAQTELAFRYEMGWGVPMDDPASLSWVQKAAAQNYPDALALLGVRYESGAGVDRSSTEALRYYRAAAEAGHARAMCYVGDMYYRAPDAVEAHRWHVAALAAGDERCAANAQISSQALPSHTRAAAEREGKELAQKYAR